MSAPKSLGGFGILVGDVVIAAPEMKPYRVTVVRGDDVSGASLSTGHSRAFKISDLEKIETGLFQEAPR